MEIFDKLKIVIEELITLKVSKVIAGGANGSTIIIDVDEKYSLFVFSSWRFIYKNVIVTHLDDPNVKYGKIPLYLKKIQDEKIKSAEIINRYDLNITFENDAILTIFSDINITSNTMDENWCLADIKTNVSYNLNNDFEYTVTKFDESK